VDKRHQLESELASLYEARVALDTQIAQVKREIELLNQQPAQHPASATETRILPDIFDLQLIKPEIINQQSPLADRFMLFMSLFAGRLDVHAQRFQRKDGRSGYSPVCAHKFNNSFCPMSPRVPGKANCITCSHQAFQQITEDEFERHEQGLDDRCCDVIGAYSTDKADHCTFIVADFDGKCTTAVEHGDSLAGWKRAAEAAGHFRQVCIANQIPAYLEVSRSGAGCHVWLFFAEPVPAQLARRLYSKLWTLTMEKHPGLDFSVYDRFIPCQDTLSSTGLQGSLGNLVALPLQGRPAKEGFSCFYDHQMLPYADQWEFLSQIKQLSLAELDQSIKRLTMVSDIGDLLPNLDDDNSQQKPWDKNRPAVTLSSTDFTDQVEIVSANMLHIKKVSLSPKAQNVIRRLVAFSNPEFYRKQRQRLSTYDQPRIITTHQEDDDYLSIPRGALPALVELLDSADALYSILDKTSPGKPINVRFTGELRDDQQQAAASLLDHDNGVISADPGYGKSVIAAYIIASLGVSSLIIVNNSQLLKQWKTKLEAFLEILDEPPLRLTPKGRKKKTDTIGEYSGSKKSLSGLVDVAMFQSLEKQGVVEDFVKDYGLVIIDEAQHVPAFSFDCVVQHVNAKHVYGLTATPSRKDRRTPILFLGCGPIRYQTNAREQAAKRPFEHYLIPRFTGFLMTSTKNETSFTALLGDLTSDNDRNSLIADDVARALDEGRKPIVLTDRTDHVYALAELLKGSCDNVITLVGKLGAKDRRAVFGQLSGLADDARFVIIATGQFVGEGFDYPRLDTLFLAVPISWKGRIAQYAGRLHRIYDGKADVRIYDYVDTSIPMLNSMYHKRLKSYKSIGYQIMTVPGSSDSSDNRLTNSLIYGKDDYWPVFQLDCTNTIKEVVISSPKLALHQINRVTDALASPLLRNAVITVWTLPPDDLSPSAKATAQAGIELLRERGVKVATVSGLFQKYTIIDQQIIWYGSLNLLGNAMKSDNLIKLNDLSIAKRLLAESSSANKPQTPEPHDSKTQLGAQ